MISHLGLWFKDEAVKFNVKAVDMDRDFDEKIKALTEGL